MLEVARERVPPEVELVHGEAGQLPFVDESFDALTFTYLLRYVDDPAATLSELARVVRPGGTIASLEFGLPEHPLVRATWEAYVGIGLPTAGRLISSGWTEVCGFLGDSIRDFWGTWPLERLLEAWRDAGVEDVQSRSLTFGGGVVIWGRRS